MYLTGVSNPTVRAFAQDHPGMVGLLNTPNAGYLLHDWDVWAADNGCFQEKTYVGDDAWMAWLEKNAEHAVRCLFATAPDVVGDAVATLARSAPWLPQIRALGYKAAFVAQDGLEHLDVPWDTFDVLFIGGTDDWKLGPAAADLAARARAHGKRVHMGKVSSFKRLRHAELIGCETADGTFLRFAGTDGGLPRMRKWFERRDAKPVLPWGTA